MLAVKGPSLRYSDASVGDRFIACDHEEQCMEGQGQLTSTPSLFQPMFQHMYTVHCMLPSGIVMRTAVQ